MLRRGHKALTLGGRVLIFSWRWIVYLAISARIVAGRAASTVWGSITRREHAVSHYMGADVVRRERGPNPARVLTVGVALSVVLAFSLGTVIAPPTCASEVVPPSSSAAASAIPSVQDTDFPHLVPTPKPTPAPTPQPGPFLGWPVAGGAGRFTCYFSTYHPAVDIAAACGTHLLASLSGTIVFEGWKTNGGGIVVDISTGAPPTEGYPGRTGWFLSYNHMAMTVVNTGQKVVRGQYIGQIGRTGNATGCHVHFMVAHLGRWVNPLPLL